MSFKRLIALCSLMMLLLVPSIVLAQVPSNAKVAIVNKRNPARYLSRTQVKNFYLGNDSFWGGVVKVNLFLGKDGSPSGQAVEEITGMSFKDLSARWTKKILAGQGKRPKVFSSVSEVARKIATTPGGIAIITGADTGSLSVFEGEDIKLIEVR